MLDPSDFDDEILAAADQRDRSVGQESLFGALPDSEWSEEPKLIEIAPWGDRERLAHEKELLGFYVSGHPLGGVAAVLSRYTDCTAGTTEGRKGREVRVGGLLTGLKETITKRGKRMAFGSLEDLEGVFELVIFSESYSLHFDLLRQAQDGGESGEGPIPLLVSGKLEEADPPKILVSDIMRLDEGEQRLTTSFRIRLVEGELADDRMQALRGVLEAYPGYCEVFLHFTIPGESETVVAVGGVAGVDPCAALQRDVDALFGRAVAECGL